MVVQHNMQAMNANRMLGVTTGAQAKSTEKLSSGYRINRAADDAAGLTISEKMRKQIRGLSQASTNAQDGVSAVQTAEGALTEVHSMLQRMNELATQASTGTNSESDRQAIQDEISQLTTEIDRVAETTKFNETYLLKGGKSTTTKTLDAHDAGIKGTFVDAGGDKATLTVDLSVGKSISIAGQNYNIVEGTDAATASDSLSKLQKDIKEVTDTDTKITIDGTEYTSKSEDGKLVFDAGTGTTYSAEELAGKVKDGASVKMPDTAEAVIARDYTDTKTNITAGQAAAKITQALTQANNIGATATTAEVKPGEPDKTATSKVQTIENGGAVKATAGMMVYDKNAKTLTALTNEQDITKYATDTANYTLYKEADAVAGIKLDADGKATSSILVTHTADATTAGIESVFDKGAAVTAGGGVAVNNGTVTATTDYKLYEEVNLVADATFENASHEAYAKLTQGTITKNDFALNFTKITSETGSDAAKIVEGQNALKAEIGNISYTTSNAADKGKFSHAFADNSKLDIDETGKVSYDGVEIAQITATVTAGQTQAAGTDKLGLDGTFKDAVFEAKDADNSYTFEITKGTSKVAEDLTLNLHVGSDADMTNKISVGVASMSSTGLGISGINVADDSGIAATYAIDAIEDAIKTVSAQRSSLGAVQNRLEHTIANLDNVVENTTASESRIRDTDMAEEMVEYSKNNILAQAGQSMLAQANQSTQGVLSLLG